MYNKIDTTIFKAATLFIVAQTMNKSNDQSEEKWINKSWSIHIIEYLGGAGKSRGLEVRIVVSLRGRRKYLSGVRDAGHLLLVEVGVYVDVCLVL